ncbi:MAG: DNA-3-methyladenine glycosylase I [Candidatus Bathyarchaeota archaeon]|nr:DNA-3-methyladenine glycosylase I [Candidatus Bathyarchaeota archaeon]
MLEVNTVNEGSWSPPKWMYRNRRLPNDDAYFENMTRVVFLVGANWKTVGEPWSDFKKAFNNFSVDAVAKFNKEDSTTYG